jgi:hypothetical protein
MLASINPLGERARNTRWGRTVSWYTVGSTAGGLVIGGGAGLLGAALRAAAVPSGAVLGGLAAGVCVLGSALDLGLGGVPLPTIRRQVNEDWLARYRGWVYGGLFGFQLGLGVVTIVTTATVYVALVLAVLAGSVPAGLVIGGTFGLVRALPIFAVAKAADPARIRTVVRRADSLSGPAGVAAISALVLVAVLSVAAAVG